MKNIPIDTSILMRQASALGGLAYVNMVNRQNRIDAALMSVNSGAKHSRNPMHYKLLSSGCLQNLNFLDRI